MLSGDQKDRGRDNKLIPKVIPYSLLHILVYPILMPISFHRELSQSLFFTILGKSKKRYPILQNTFVMSLLKGKQRSALCRQKKRVKSSGKKDSLKEKILGIFYQLFARMRVFITSDHAKELPDRHLTSGCQSRSLPHDFLNLKSVYTSLHVFCAQMFAHSPSGNYICPTFFSSVPT
jgi:hypothetical protein